MSFEYDKKYYSTKSADIIVSKIIEIFNPKSVVDIGCGTGNWLNSFMNFGIDDVLGLDLSSLEQDKLLIPLDQRKTINVMEEFDLKRKFDLAITLEVAEHIPQDSADIFVNNLVNHSDIIIFSSAIPNQGGDGHINEQYADYWEEKFRSHQYYFLDILRPLFWDNQNIDWWYRQNIFVVIKKDLYFQFKTVPSVLSLRHPDKLYKELEHWKSDYTSLVSGKKGIKLAIYIFFKSVIRLI